MSSIQSSRMKPTPPPGSAALTNESHSKTVWDSRVEGYIILRDLDRYLTKLARDFLLLASKTHTTQPWRKKMWTGMCPLKETHSSASKGKLHCHTFSPFCKLHSAWWVAVGGYSWVFPTVSIWALMARIERTPPNILFLPVRLYRKLLDFPDVLKIIYSYIY